MNLNTSNVTVNLNQELFNSIAEQYLNTSNVTVNHTGYS